MCSPDVWLCLAEEVYRGQSTDIRIPFQPPCFGTSCSRSSRVKQNVDLSVHFNVSVCLFPFLCDPLCFSVSLTHHKIHDHAHNTSTLEIELFDSLTHCLTSAGWTKITAFLLLDHNGPLLLEAVKATIKLALFFARTERFLSGQITLSSCTQTITSDEPKQALCTEDALPYEDAGCHDEDVKGCLLPERPQMQSSSVAESDARSTSKHGLESFTRVKFVVFA